MKLANEINELLKEEYKQNYKNEQGEAGDTSTELGHWHKTDIDVNGNGRTIQTLPDDYPRHEHQIVNNIAIPGDTPDSDHSHKVIA